MTAVAFYHLKRWPLEQALPKLLEKTLASGKRGLVMAGSPERVEALNTLLWTYDPDSWLPHGGIKDGSPQAQPIWLTCEDENPNGATYLFLTDGADSPRVGEFERCFDLFDGNDEETVLSARERWKACKAAGHDLTYWQQTESGGWEKKG
ncbi:MAG: DNA polymerase III subunit chi [Magnetospirillum sp. WYHS-4]